MASLEMTVKAWDEAHWEFSEALRDLPDDLVWKRPHPALLSVGELAGHIAYWESIRMSGLGPDGDHGQPNLELVPIKSPLIDPVFRYYTHSIGAPVDLGMSTAELASEMSRVHQESKALFLSEEHDSTDIPPGNPGMTWGGTMTYMVFHVAYHTGQAYSARHLLGDTPPDN